MRNKVMDKGLLIPICETLIPEFCYDFKYKRFYFTVITSPYKE